MTQTTKARRTRNARVDYKGEACSPAELQELLQNVAEDCEAASAAAARDPEDDPTSVLQWQIIAEELRRCNRTTADRLASIAGVVGNTEQH